MKISNILGILFSVLVGLFVFFVGIDVQSESAPNKIYKVYLNGVTVGLIKSEAELINFIDDKQNKIKLKYMVDKVYPPKGLEIREEYTYSNKINTVEEIYNIIQDKNPFTISGYTAIIKYPEEVKENEEEKTNKKDAIYLNLLRKEDFEEGFKNVIKAFVGSDEYELFASDNQSEITDVGSKIETIYWEENITIKENLINVDSFIFENEDDISKYLLFGTLEEQKKYTIKEGDDISTISYNNMLSTEEFLVANPEFLNENVLLTPGQSVNIGLIKPIVTIVAELHVVEDIVNRYKTEYIDDKESYYGTQKVTQEGSDGITRVTEKVLYRNGEIQNLLIIHNLSQEITPVVNEVILRGIKSYSYSGFQYYSSGAWYWPTLNRCVITSRFGPRWGTNHNGIDISGTGQRSPIYASNDGIVIVNEYNNKGYGYLVVIDHQNGYITLYAHLDEKGLHSVGKKVKRGEVVGLMGNTGRSDGTHLHFEIIKDTEFRYKNHLNPCNSIFKC
ncbi:MAG: M23 family metallopeptidase [Bacilli bacterium]|nr:M23 family metallopeptidase [Bacilli bacterium]